MKTLLALVLIATACGSADGISKGIGASKSHSGNTGSALTSDTPAENITAPTVIIPPTVILSESQVTDELDQSSWQQLDANGNECVEGAKYVLFFDKGTETITTSTYADSLCNGDPTGTHTQKSFYGVDGNGNIEFNTAAIGQFTEGADSQAITDNSENLSFSGKDTNYVRLSYMLCPPLFDKTYIPVPLDTYAEAHAAAITELAAIRASGNFAQMSDMLILPVHN